MKKWFGLFVLLLLQDSLTATVILVTNAGGSNVTAYELSNGNELGSPFPITEDLSIPTGLAINPSQTRLYVSDEMNNTINTYDLSTGQKLTTLLSGLPHPRGITLNAAGTILYVANFNGPAAAYNAMTGASIQTYSADMSSYTDVALSPDGNTLYVSNFAGSKVVVYNATTGSTLGFSPITTGLGEATAVAVSLDGSILYVCSQSTSAILTYNALTGAIIDNPFLDSADGLDQPYSIQLSDDGTTLYVGNFDGNAIIAFNSTTGAPIGSPFPITEDVQFSTAFAFSLSAVTAPTNLSGVQKRDGFALEYELFNQLSWTASPSAVSGYFVYRNNVKIATLDASTLSYTDHNRKKGIATTYSVTAFDQAGTQSSATTCIVN
jgi:DNA-binding beta-propeller fold protein YncE